MPIETSELLEPFTTEAGYRIVTLPLSAEAREETGETGYETIAYSPDDEDVERATSSTVMAANAVHQDLCSRYAAAKHAYCAPCAEDVTFRGEDDDEMACAQCAKEFCQACAEDETACINCGSEDADVLHHDEDDEVDVDDWGDAGATVGSFE